MAAGDGLTMPYVRREDRIAAKRRYNASPKGQETRRRYYLAHKPQPAPNPAPLAQALTAWRMQ
jgi:hypothetical protein